jgi:hypothetical protein
MSPERALEGTGLLAPIMPVKDPDIEQVTTRNVGVKELRSATNF